MSNAIDALDPVEVGARLRQARELAKLTQAEAATAINVARTTLVSVEQGQRRVRIVELQQFAKLYSTSINALLRQETPQIELVPRFRRLDSAQDPALEAAVELFSQLVNAEVGLENILGIRRSQEYPPERPVRSGDVRMQAETDADELRRWLGIGLGPILDIASLLELQVGARVFIRPVDQKISGMFAFEEPIGPCIFLNANHPRDRRNQTGAHELGHFIGTRRRPDVLDDSTSDRARDERYAHAFARAFLTPAAAVRRRFHEIVSGAAQITRRHVIVLAHGFGVSREAMVRRLEELGLVRSGTWDWFCDNGGISDEQARSVLGKIAFEDGQRADADRPLSLRLSILADQAWREGLLSEGQLARLLRMERVAIRAMLDGLTIGESEPDESPDLFG